MTPSALLVGLGGAFGAVARFTVGELLDAHPLTRDIPASTLAVNVLGTFLLGLLTFNGAGDETMLLVGTGACGAFTTFSSFSVQTVERWEAGRRALAVGYALGTLAAAGGALGVAWLLVG
ncbi:fluoride efflux transporter CrcB [Halolamina sp.]|jgi:CrcB protein|uniref:fluoride efflux transporter CrcB n=1 Tax=Halolamina sp. TaxID=1940283 RepID=UPI000223B69E|nr:CrcB-like protein [halophilic archaeon DL31]